MESISEHVFHSSLFDEEYKVGLIPPQDEEMFREGQMPSQEPVPGSLSGLGSPSDAMDALSLGEYSPYPSELLSPYSFPSPHYFPSSFPMQTTSEFELDLPEPALPRPPLQSRSRTGAIKRQASYDISIESPLLSASDNPEDTSNDPSLKQDLERKRRLERNRTSARLSRKKKKEHYERLAVQAKRLQEEVEFYKAELARVTGKEPAAEAKEFVDAIKLTQTIKEKSAVKHALGQMWLQLGSVSRDKERDSKFLLIQLIERLLPPFMKYFLYMAETRTGVYAEGGGLRTGAGAGMGMGAGAGEDGRAHRSRSKQPSKEKIRKLLELDKEEYEGVRGQGESIRECCGRIRKKIEAVITAKDELVDELKSLGSLLSFNVYSKIDSSGALNLVKLVEREQRFVSRHLRHWMHAERLEEPEEMPRIAALLPQEEEANGAHNLRKRPKNL